ncbi:GmrSD restriction endonuclease domain-containing protein [Tomitella cavernea]|uniref:GmrSD restriction endonuclease domain-containing protein n=1 Tax=Tomitella cavernea TaxID=1387982 RepID=UPI0031F02208
MTGARPAVPALVQECAVHARWPSARHLPALSLAVVAATLAAGCASAVGDGPTTPVPSTATGTPAAQSSGTHAPTATGTPSALPPTSDAGGPGGATGADPDAAEVRALLAGLPVKGRAPKTGYNRDMFGQAWSDDVTVDGGHNGCDTRNDILRRDLTELTYRPGSHGCTVLTGLLDDAYTGKRIEFTRGRGTSRDVQIDHVVALSDAWQKGAQQLSSERRRNLANDPLNLQAVDGPANQQKGAGDAATWLPPSKPYRCTYVSRQVRVKDRYDLWVTTAERDAINRILDGCEGTGAAPAAPADAAGTAPAAGGNPPAPADGAGVHFRNCAQAREAGAAPVHAGDPGYRPGLDGDRDGVACE